MYYFFITISYETSDRCNIIAKRSCDAFVIFSKIGLYNLIWTLIYNYFKIWVPICKFLLFPFNQIKKNTKSHLLFLITANHTLYIRIIYLSPYYYAISQNLTIIARVLCDNSCFFHLLIATGLLRQTPCNKIVIIWVLNNLLHTCVHI